MDDNSCDFEFFDFDNATEEEIEEIHSILKGPQSNGSVELPWEISLKEAPAEIVPENEGQITKESTHTTEYNSKQLETVLSPTVPFTSQHAPVSPVVAHMPPPPRPLETYIATPTTVGPYPNPPYFVSRTIPYLRAYPHMGVPFFACPIPGTAGEGSSLPSPYGQFVPVVPATVAQEKFVGILENESNQKIRSNDKQFNKRSKKKSSSDYSSGSFESETVDSYKELMPLEEHTSISSMSTSISNERPTSVPLVPLPVPPSTFAVAGGTLPLHSYPPGLHTLPYTQMSAHQAPSAAMYYVPVFNHPYGSYIPSPPSAPMVLPVSVQPEASSPVVSNSSVNLQIVSPPVSFPKPVENTSQVQSNDEQVSSEQCANFDEEKPSSIDSAAKNISEEDVTDCNSSSDYPMSKSVSSSPDCIPDARITDDFYDAGLPPAKEDIKQAGRDSSRCWADLFKKPCHEVNGIDSHPSNQQRHDSNVLNGKVYIPASDIH